MESSAGADGKEEGGWKGYNGEVVQEQEVQIEVEEEHGSE